MDECISLEDLKGKHILSGVDYIPSVLEPGEYDEDCGNSVILCIDGKNYVMTECLDDGYRSFMTSVFVTKQKAKNTFPEQNVLIAYKGGSDDIIEIYSMKGDLILTTGTRDYEDYYPVAEFCYYPENMEINQ